MMNFLKGTLWSLLGKGNPLPKPLGKEHLAPNSQAEPLAAPEDEPLFWGHKNAFESLDIEPGRMQKLVSYFALASVAPTVSQGFSALYDSNILAENPGFMRTIVNHEWSSLSGSETGDFSRGFSVINPATGLPMIGGMGGIDVGGSPFGMDNSWHSTSSTGFGHDWSSSSGFDHSGSGSFGMFDSSSSASSMDWSSSSSSTDWSSSSHDWSSSSSDWSSSSTDWSSSSTDWSSSSSSSSSWD